jgi:hypothetical protein
MPREFKFASLWHLEYTARIGTDELPVKVVHKEGLGREQADAGGRYIQGFRTDRTRIAMHILDNPFHRANAMHFDVVIKRFQVSDKGRFYRTDEVVKRWSDRPRRTRIQDDRELMRMVALLSGFVGAIVMR